MKKLLSILLTALFSCFSAQAAESLTFAKPGPLDYSANISETVLKEAYQRIGIDIKTYMFPAERALNMSNNGLVDGEVNRIKGLEKKYPNLMRVPVPINWIDGIAFTNNTAIEISDWESLSSYIIGLRIGAKFAEIGTSGMNVKAVATNDQVFIMLDQGKTDIAVSTRIEGLLTVKKHELDNVRIVEPPLAKLPLFHYLHKKNKNLIPKLTTVLLEMEQEGRIDQIKYDAFVVLFSDKPSTSPVN